MPNTEPIPLPPPQHFSSPRKKPCNPAAAQARDEISKFILPEFLDKKSEKTLDEFWQLHSLHKFKPEDDEIRAQFFATFKPSAFCESLNEVWKLIPSDGAADTIKFYDVGDQELINHPTATHCRPDYLAVREECLPNGKPNNIVWSMVEFVIEKASCRKDTNERILQTGGYLHYLLLARPDLLVGQALLIEEDGKFVFFFGDVDNGISHTTLAHYDKDFPSLLYAFLRRLRTVDEERLDLTIQRVYDKEANECTFDITLTLEPGTQAIDGHGSIPTEKLVCTHFGLTSSRSPFENRTHIFLSDKVLPPCHINGRPVCAIKDQYSRKGSRFTEKEVHETLQCSGKIPGIVYVVHVESSPLKPGRRTRRRMAMDQSGDQVMNVTTVKDVLCLLYDLLEVTRFIQAERLVLHRDISTGNILFDPLHRQEPTSDEEKQAFSSIHYISSMLNPSGSQWKTNLLLIDFGCGEIESNPLPQKGHAGTVGTPIFMARAIESGNPLPIDDEIKFPPLPVPHPKYKAAHPERVNRFPLVDTPVRVESMHEDKIGSLRKHLLRHDAESILWVFLYWAFLSQPDVLPATTLDNWVWSSINASWTGRDSLLWRLKERPITELHSAFMPLAPLLKSLVTQIIHDHHWITDPAHEVMTKVDYVHEALQRLILDFVIRHENDAFMTLPLSQKHRKAIGITETADASSDATNKRTRDMLEDPDDEEFDFEEEPASKKLKLEPTSPVL